MFLRTGSIFGLSDKGIRVQTDKRRFSIIFDEKKYRPSDVPILMSNISKIQNIGFKVKRNLKDIIDSQVNFYLHPVNRKNVL